MLRQHAALWERREALASRAREDERALAALDDMIRWLDVEGFRAAILAETLADLEARINILAGDFALGLRMETNSGTATLDIGTTKDGAWRSLSTLSAGECALALAVIAAAVIEKSGAQFKILCVDNLERLSEPMRTDLVGRLALIVEWGALDQLVVCCSESIDVASLRHLEKAPLVITLAADGTVLA